MKTNAILALTSLLGLAAAAPLQEENQLEERDLIVQTVVQQVVETVVATTTVWVAPGQDVPVAPTTTTTATTTPAAAEGNAANQEPATPTTTSTPVPAAPEDTPAPASAAETPQDTPAPQDPQNPPSGDTGNAGGGAGNVYPVVTLPGATSPTGPCTAAQPCTGNATFYDTGMGACGESHPPSDHVVAIYVGMMGSLSSGDQKNPLCGRKVAITAPSGATATGTVVDKCQGCNHEPHNIDLSTGLFDALGVDRSEGVIEGVKWHWA